MDYNDFDNYIKDLRSDLKDHPLAEKVFDYANSKGIIIEDFSTLIKIVEQLDNENLSDPKTIIIASEIIQSLLKLNRAYIENNTKTDI